MRAGVVILAEPVWDVGPLGSEVLDVNDRDFSVGVGDIIDGPPNAWTSLLMARRAVVT